MDTQTQNAKGAARVFPFMQIVRVLGVCALCAAGLGIAFVALLAMAISWTSDARIEANLRDAAEQGVLAPASYPRSAFGHFDHQYDMYTDCVAFGMNLSNSDVPLLRRIAESPTAAYEANDLGPCGRLVNGLEAGDLRANYGYPRFWHGYQAYLRPLLSVMPLDGLRRLTAVLFFGAIIFLMVRLAMLFGPWAWPIVALPLFAMSDFLTAAMVTTHATSIAWALASAALVPIILERCANARVMILPVFVFCAGASFNFLSFLINPPLAPALVAFFYIAVSLNRDGRNARDVVLYAMGLAVLWFGGFAAAWIEKWLLVAAVLGPDAILNELSVAVTNYEAARVRMEVNFLGATRRNVESDGHLFAYLLSAGLLSAGLMIWALRDKAARLNNAIKFMALVTPLVVVVAWVEANAAHSVQHMGFVSRSFLLLAIIPILAAIKVLQEEPRRAK